MQFKCSGGAVQQVRALQGKFDEEFLVIMIVWWIFLGLPRVIEVLNRVVMNFEMKF